MARNLLKNMGRAECGTSLKNFCGPKITGTGENFMERNEYDAIVVGAGPSGSSCAALLSAKGARVLLLDKEKFPRDKPCGDAIGGKALNVLAELGLDSELSAMGFLRSSGMILSSPDGTEAEVPLVWDGKAMSGGFVCRRLDFDNLVFSHAKKLCETIEQAEFIELVGEKKS